jgi:peptidoglycan hydrolase CwlO-like protein
VTDPAAAPDAALQRTLDETARLLAELSQQNAALAIELEDALLLEREVAMQREVISELGDRADGSAAEAARLRAEHDELVQRARAAEAHAAAVEARYLYRLTARIAELVARLRFPAHVRRALRRGAPEARG